MKIAILGGGLTGLTAAYFLQKKEQEVFLYEKEESLGGLASGFKEAGWDWYLDRAYHHIFDCDNNIIDFSNKIGFKEIFFQSPETASLYFNKDYRIIPVDTPQDFMKFPLLALPIKIRAAFVLAFLKVSPFLSVYEKTTAKEFLITTMGEKAWIVFWQELFRKKFGKYAENILASFIWSRIHKRSKNLGYFTGGFQNLIDYVETVNTMSGVVIKKKTEIISIEKKGSGFILNNTYYDAIISTLPTPVIVKLGVDIFPDTYIKQLKKISYLHAVNLILETSKPILDKTYWLSICDPKLPMMVIVQHTNFIDKKYYGNNHLAYIAKYVDNDDMLLKMNKEAVIEFYLSHLKTLNSSLQDKQLSILNSFLFKAPFAQPIFDKTFLKNKPEFETPIKNFYMANLDMTYPNDRGTNYAVKLGKDVSSIISQ
ncbi:MAG: FAD-dependent oxidoreductase [bacterium]|nr:FAD-dependent oxidoreductase [bacterium]